MKESSVIRLAFFYLALLVSHEGITVASNIRQTIGLQKGAELSSSLNNMVQMMENVDVDSFLEVEDMHGMSAEAYGTMEMIEMHKSLKEGFSFEHSPILEDLKSLKEIPENKVLSPSELKQHREDVSVLLEKAMSSSSMGLFGKAMEGLEKMSTKTSSSLGSCERTGWSTCGKHSDCRPDKDDPCRGECICGTDGINECKCVAKGTIAKQQLKNLDTGKALAHTKEIDKALTVKGAIGAALFGFVDGFFSGMASELRDAFEDPKCHATGNVHQKLKHVIHKLKHMWSHMKKVHKKVWTSEGRKAIIHAVKEFIVSLIKLLKEGLKYMWQCPATKMLVVMVGVIAVMLIMNIAFMAAGFVVIPLIVKYVGMIMGLYFSFTYMKDKVVSLYQGMKKMIAKECHGTCKKKMIEDSFGMVGAITEIIVLSGLDKVLKIKADKAKPFLKRFGMDFHPQFKDDMKILGAAAKNAKYGMKNVLKKLTGKYGLKSKNSDVLKKEYQLRKQELAKQQELNTKNGKGMKKTKARSGKQWQKRPLESDEKYLKRLIKKKKKIQVNVENALTEYGKDSMEYQNALKAKDKATKLINKAWTRTKYEKMRREELKTKNGEGMKETKARTDKQWQKQKGESPEAYVNRVNEKRGKLKANVDDALKEHGENSEKYSNAMEAYNRIKLQTDADLKRYEKYIKKVRKKGQARDEVMFTTKKGKGMKETKARTDKQWKKQHGESDDDFFKRLGERRRKLDIEAERVKKEYGKDSKEYEGILAAKEKIKKATEQHRKNIDARKVVKKARNDKQQFDELKKQSIEKKKTRNKQGKGETDHDYAKKLLDRRKRISEQVRNMKKQGRVRSPKYQKTYAALLEVRAAFLKSSIPFMKESIAYYTEIARTSLWGLDNTNFAIDDRKWSRRRRLLTENKVKFFWNWVNESTSEVFEPKCWEKGGDRTKKIECEGNSAKFGLKEFILNKTSITGNDQRRRLLSKVIRGDDIWDDIWADFLLDVESDEDNVKECEVHESLDDVLVDSDGAYRFSCLHSPDLCNCISAAADDEVSTQYFVNQNMGIYLGIFRNDGGEASYEICEEVEGKGAECHAYGDVNDGMVDRRRRRLLQNGGGGS